MADIGSGSLISGISNQNLFGGVSSLFGGITSAVSGFEQADALESQAKGYGIATQFALENAALAGEAGGIKELAQARQIQRLTGSEQAVAAANGQKIAGSASSIIRDSVQQGYLSEGVIGLNTAIAATNFYGQAAAFQAQQQASQQAASAAQTSGILGGIGGVVGGIAKLFL